MSDKEKIETWWNYKDNGEKKTIKDKLNILSKYKLDTIYNVLGKEKNDAQKFLFKNLLYEMETDQPISNLVYDMFYVKLDNIKNNINYFYKHYSKKDPLLSNLLEIYEKIFDQITTIHIKHTTNKIQELSNEFIKDKRGLKREQLSQLETQLSQLETTSTRNQILSDMEKESQEDKKGSYRNLTIMFGDPYAHNYIKKHQRSPIIYNFRDEAERILTEEVEPIYSKTITATDINSIFDTIDKKTLGNTFDEYSNKKNNHYRNLSIQGGRKGSKKRLGKKSLRKKSLRKKSLRKRSLKKRNSKKH